MTRESETRLEPEAPVNDGDNHNRPKVNRIAFVKPDHMLEYLSILCYAGNILPLVNMPRNKALSADNQQERAYYYGKIF